jgi:hypothetical protein
LKKNGFQEEKKNDAKFASKQLNTIVKIYKYKGLHEGHHFILMAMEVQGAPGHDMDRFFRECVRLFHDRRSKGHLFLFCWI